MNETHFDWKQKTTGSKKTKFVATYKSVRMEYKPDTQLVWVGNGPDTMKFKNIKSLKEADQLMSDNINKILEIS